MSRRPKPTAIRRLEGNRGKRAWNHDEPEPPDGIPRCPNHLAPVARTEWRRVARALHAMGVLTPIDRAALAAYCQSYAKWVEAEQKLKETPPLVKTPSGYVQQSPWLLIANKQLELMGRYMTELGMTPASRSRVAAADPRMQVPTIEFRTIYEADPVADFKKKIETMARRMEPEP
jgi:P27 family predicted phage terminase small subunit